MLYLEAFGEKNVQKNVIPWSVGRKKTRLPRLGLEKTIIKEAVIVQAHLYFIKYIKLNFINIFFMRVLNNLFRT